MNSVENKNVNKIRYRKNNRYKNYREKRAFKNDDNFSKSSNPDILKKANKKQNSNFSKTGNKTKSFISNLDKNSARYKKAREKSCGCIIINNGKVLLIQQKRGNWGFPKGHVEFNETETQTAIREVKEETNLDVKIYNKRRYTEKYFTYKGRVKQVVYFVAKQTGGFEKRQESEIRAMKWLKFDEAFEKITYPNTKNLFGKVLRDLK